MSTAASPLPALIDRPDIDLGEAPVGARPGDPEPPSVRFFRLLNRFFMVPLTRAGLGAWMSTPVGGAMVLLRIRGRKSGLVRETPLNYLVAEGCIWVVAGYGPRTEWYRNLLADPRVEAVLPGRVVTGRVTEVRTPAVRRRIIPPLIRSTAGPSLAAGLNPFRLTPDELLERMAWVPLLRIDADEGWLDPTPDDPGGHAWIWRQALIGAATVGVAAAAWRATRASWRLARATTRTAGVVRVGGRVAGRLSQGSGAARSARSRREPVGASPRCPCAKTAGAGVPACAAVAVLDRG